MLDGKAVAAPRLEMTDLKAASNLPCGMVKNIVVV
jgi:hypothetical protein